MVAGAAEIRAGDDRVVPDSSAKPVTAGSSSPDYGCHGSGASLCGVGGGYEVGVVPALPAGVCFPKADDPVQRKDGAEMRGSLRDGCSLTRGGGQVQGWARALAAYLLSGEMWTM